MRVKGTTDPKGLSICLVYWVALSFQFAWTLAWVIRKGCREEKEASEAKTCEQQLNEVDLQGDNGTGEELLEEPSQRENDNK